MKPLINMDAFIHNFPMNLKQTHFGTTMDSFSYRVPPIKYDNF